MGIGKKSLVLLLFSDILVFFAHVFLRTKLGFFHLEKEGNLGSLQAGIKFWLAATLAYLSVWILYRSDPHRSRLFLLLLVSLGTGLAYIGLDDMLALHERAGFVISNLLGTGGFYGESFNWLLYFSPFIFLALGVFGWLLVWFRKINAVVFYFFLFGILLCIFSLGAEWIGGKMVVSVDVNVERYRQLILLEEGFEMVGASFLTAAMFALITHTVRLVPKL